MCGDCDLTKSEWSCDVGVCFRCGGGQETNEKCVDELNSCSVCYRYYVEGVDNKSDWLKCGDCKRYCHKSCRNYISDEYAPLGPKYSSLAKYKCLECARVDKERTEKLQRAEEERRMKLQKADEARRMQLILSQARSSKELNALNAQHKQWKDMELKKDQYMELIGDASELLYVIEKEVMKVKDDARMNLLEARRRLLQEEADKEKKKKEKSAADKVLARLKKMFEEIRMSLVKSNDSFHFRKPVDRKQYPLYYKVVQKPIDLTKLGKMIQKGLIRTREAFIGALELMYENACAFNTVDSPVSVCALDLLRLAKAKVEQNKVEFMKIERQVQLPQSAAKPKGGAGSSGSGSKAARQPEQPDLSSKSNIWREREESTMYRSVFTAMKFKRTAGFSVTETQEQRAARFARMKKRKRSVSDVDKLHIAEGRHQFHINSIANEAKLAASFINVNITNPLVSEEARKRMVKKVRVMKGLLVPTGGDMGLNVVSWSGKPPEKVSGNNLPTGKAKKQEMRKPKEVASGSEGTNCEAMNDNDSDARDAAKAKLIQRGGPSSSSSSSSDDVNSANQPTHLSDYSSSSVNESGANEPTKMNVDPPSPSSANIMPSKSSELTKMSESTSSPVDKSNTMNVPALLGDPAPSSSIDNSSAIEEIQVSDHSSSSVDKSGTNEAAKMSDSPSSPVDKSSATNVPAIPGDLEPSSSIDNSSAIEEIQVNDHSSPSVDKSGTNEAAKMSNSPSSPVDKSSKSESCQMSDPLSSSTDKSSVCESTPKIPSSSCVDVDQGSVTQPTAQIMSIVPPSSSAGGCSASQPTTKSNPLVSEKEIDAFAIEFILKEGESLGLSIQDGIYIDADTATEVSAIFLTDLLPNTQASKQFAAMGKTIVANCTRIVKYKSTLGLKEAIKAITEKGGNKILLTFKTAEKMCASKNSKGSKKKHGKPANAVSPSAESSPPGLPLKKRKPEEHSAMHAGKKTIGFTGPLKKRKFVMGDSPTSKPDAPSGKNSQAKDDEMASKKKKSQIKTKKASVKKPKVKKEGAAATKLKPPLKNKSRASRLKHFERRARVTMYEQTWDALGFIRRGTRVKPNIPIVTPLVGWGKSGGEMGPWRDPRVCCFCNCSGDDDGGIEDDGADVVKCEVIDPERAKQEHKMKMAKANNGGVLSECGVLRQPAAEVEVAAAAVAMTIDSGDSSSSSANPLLAVDGKCNQSASPSEPPMDVVGPEQEGASKPALQIISKQVERPKEEKARNLDGLFSGRLVPFDFLGSGAFTHVSCALWSSEVFENEFGKLFSVQKSRTRTRGLICAFCSTRGASLGCCARDCKATYHFKCGYAAGGVFCDDKSFYCKKHKHIATGPKHKVLDPKGVSEMMRCITVAACNDPGQQKASSTSGYSKFAKPDVDVSAYNSGHVMRLGALVVHSLGEIDTKSDNFHDTHYIYPKGFCSTRIFWSTVAPRTRTVYALRIVESEGSALFVIRAADDQRLMIASRSAKDAYEELVSKTNLINAAFFSRPFDRNSSLPVRRNFDAVTSTLALASTAASSSSANDNSAKGVAAKKKDVQGRFDSTIPYGLSAAHFFGFGLNPVRRELEALENAKFLAVPLTAESLRYEFCFIRPTQEWITSVQRTRAAMEAESELVNASGCARSEGMAAFDKSAGRGRITRALLDNEEKTAKGNALVKGSRAQKRNTRRYEDKEGDRVDYSQQYSELKSVPIEQRLCPLRSHIHGWGLFTKVEICANDMIIEYCGELIRSCVSDRREADYESRGIGSCYMFRVDKERIVDATLSGCMARFMNHCCVPNAYAKTISVPNGSGEGGGQEKKIVIFAKSDIKAGEEVVSGALRDHYLPNFCFAFRNPLSHFPSLLNPRVVPGIRLPVCSRGRQLEMHVRAPQVHRGHELRN